MHREIYLSHAHHFLHAKNKFDDDGIKPSKGYFYYQKEKNDILNDGQSNLLCQSN
jgi:hypothetical protein